MLNNRQGGRRRGRGGQRPQGGSNRPEQGNRIDNRARGNAAQLLEKYKSLARDAQTQGDRVNAEYFFQYADHYFRVLGESRARFDEQRRQRDDYSQDEDGDGDDNRGDYAANDRDEPRHDRGERPERSERNDERRRERSERAERADRPERADRQQREFRGPDQEPQRAQPMNGGEAHDEDRPRRARPRREQMNGDHDQAPAAFDASLLPPAIGASEPAADDSSDEAPAPRRRGRPRKADVAATPDAA